MQRTYCAESLSNSKETNIIISRSQGRLDQRKWRKEPGHLEGMSLAFNDSFSTIPAGSSQTFQMVALHTTLAKFQPLSRHVFVQQGWHCRSRHQSRYNCIPLDIWIRHWVFTHLVGKHGQFSICVIPPWSLNVTDTDAYPYINKCIYIYLKKTCHLLISWTVIARYQLLCEIELGKRLCSFNPFIQPTVLSFLAICTASISKGIKTALHSGSLLRRSSLSLLRRFNIQGYWSNWTESFSQTGSMKPHTTNSELQVQQFSGLMAIHHPGSPRAPKKSFGHRGIDLEVAHGHLVESQAVTTELLETGYDIKQD